MQDVIDNTLHFKGTKFGSSRQSAFNRLAKSYKRKKSASKADVEAIEADTNAAEDAAISPLHKGLTSGGGGGALELTEMGESKTIEGPLGSQTQTEHWSSVDLFSAAEATNENADRMTITSTDENEILRDGKPKVKKAWVPRYAGGGLRVEGRGRGRRQGRE